MSWELAAAGSSLLGGLLSGGEQKYPEQLKGNLVNVNPFAARLHQMMVGRYAKGLGDFGFGGQTKQGLSALRQLMGDRGITTGSGAYRTGEENVIGQAMAAAARNRQNYGLQLASMPMQVMGVTGNNYAYNDNIWKSPAMQALKGMM
jgi:hypothetical protein